MKKLATTQLSQLVLFRADLVKPGQWERVKKQHAIIFPILLVIALILGGIVLFSETVSVEILQLVVVVSIGVERFVHTRRQRGQIIGTIDFDREGISVSTDGSTQKFPYNELSDLSIERGATFHRSDHENRPMHLDNHLRFTFREQAYHFEFRLDNEDHNELFQDLLPQLRSQGVRFRYRSI